MNNLTIDHKRLATHFNKSNESMRQLKRKYEKIQAGFWVIYVKAYNYDTSESVKETTIERRTMS